MDREAMMAAMAKMAEWERMNVAASMILAAADRTMAAARFDGVLAANLHWSGFTAEEKGN